MRGRFGGRAFCVSGAKRGNVRTCRRGTMLRGRRRAGRRSARRPIVGEECPKREERAHGPARPPLEERDRRRRRSRFVRKDGRRGRKRRAPFNLEPLHVHHARDGFVRPDRGDDRAGRHRRAFVRVGRPLPVVHARKHGHDGGAYCRICRRAPGEQRRRLA